MTYTYKLVGELKEENEQLKREVNILKNRLNKTRNDQKTKQIETVLQLVKFIGIAVISALWMLVAAMLLHWCSYGW